MPSQEVHPIVNEILENGVKPPTSCIEKGKATMNKEFIKKDYQNHRKLPEGISDELTLEKDELYFIKNIQNITLDELESKLNINKFKNLDKQHLIDWSINENNKISIKSRKKVTLNEVIGIIDDNDCRNAIELKRNLYK